MESSNDARTLPLEHADAVRAAHNAERARDRARRKLAKLDTKIAAGGHDHLKRLRDKTAAAIGGVR